MLAWYLVYSKPRAEKLALENLARQGFETYLPLVRSRRRRLGRRAESIEPMFPRYLFIRLSNETDNWSPIRSTIGVANLVRFANRAARVPDDFISEMKLREDDSGVQPEVSVPVNPGETVRIEQGVFTGYEAIFCGKSGKDRVLLLLEVAGKTARVQVADDQVALI